MKCLHQRHPRELARDNFAPFPAPHLNFCLIRTLLPLQCSLWIILSILLKPAFALIDTNLLHTLHSFYCIFIHFKQISDFLAFSCIFSFLALTAILFFSIVMHHFSIPPHPYADGLNLRFRWIVMANPFSRNASRVTTPNGRIYQMTKITIVWKSENFPNNPSHLILMRSCKNMIQHDLTWF